MEGQLIPFLNTMGELAEERIHHVLECGIAVFEAERTVMDYLYTKKTVMISVLCTSTGCTGT